MENTKDSLKSKAATLQTATKFSFKKGFAAQIETFSTAYYDVKVEPCDNVIKYSDMVRIKNVEFHETDNGEYMVDGDVTGYPLESEVSRSDDPDSLNPYVDSQLLRAIWFLKYATVRQCMYVIHKSKECNPKLCVPKDPNYEYVKKRLTWLAKEGLLWKYKIVDHNDKRNVLSAYSLKEAGVAFLNSVSISIYKSYPFTSAAIPNEILGRLSENEIIRRICTSARFESFEKPHLVHNDTYVKEQTYDTRFDIDYNIVLKVPDSSDPSKQTKLNLMVQFVPDPKARAAVDEEDEVNKYYKILANISKEFLVIKEGKVKKKGEAKILFVCETKDAAVSMREALCDIQTKNTAEYYDSHCLKYMFTTEKLAVYAENFERQPFTTGIFNITPFYPEEEVLKDGKPVLGPDGKPLKRPGSKKKYRYVAASKIF